jgi:hypothetical protein
MIHVEIRDPFEFAVLSFWLDQQGGPVVVNTSKCA